MTVCAAPGSAVSAVGGGVAPAGPVPAGSVPVPGEGKAPPGPRRTGFAFAADGSYAACLAAGEDGGLVPERWALGCPEPYPVRLPGARPEEPGTELLPLPDGRVLACRRAAAGRWTVAVLTPTGPGTADVPLGALDADEVRLLPVPGYGSVLAVALGFRGGRTAVWLLTAGDGPVPVAALPGRLGGGVWLDRAGRLLAVDARTGGRVRTVALDLSRGTATPLLELAPESNDRLLLADPESGLLVVRSDAPGADRLGWGVLGSGQPVRFPECLRRLDVAAAPFAAEPFAVEPGRALTPEGCGVALRVPGPGGVRLAVWRPEPRYVAELPAPEGWLAAAGVWTGEGLRLPCTGARGAVGVVTVTVPGRRPGAVGAPRAVPLAEAPLGVGGATPVG
jgi:hypothetical protein